MHLSVINDNTHITCIATGQRSVLHAIHDTLKNSRHEACINSTTDNRVDEYEFAAPFQVNLFATLDIDLKLLSVDLVRCRIGHTFSVRLNDEMNLTELASTARLLFVTILSARHLCDSLAIRYACRLKLDSELLIILKTPL